MSEGESSILPPDSGTAAHNRQRMLRPYRLDNIGLSDHTHQQGQTMAKKHF